MIIGTWGSYRLVMDDADADKFTIQKAGKDYMGEVNWEDQDFYESDFFDAVGEALVEAGGRPLHHNPVILAQWGKWRMVEVRSSDSGSRCTRIEENKGPNGWHWHYANASNVLCFVQFCKAITGPRCFFRDDISIYQQLEGLRPS